MQGKGKFGKVSFLSEFDGFGYDENFSGFTFIELKRNDSVEFGTIFEEEFDVFVAFFHCHEKRFARKFVVGLSHGKDKGFSFLKFRIRI